MRGRSRCKTGKVRYKDQLGAKIALANIALRDKPGHEQYRYYRCEFCYGWHTTSHTIRTGKVDGEDGNG